MGNDYLTTLLEDTKLQGGNEKGDGASRDEDLKPDKPLETTSQNEQVEHLQELIQAIEEVAPQFAGSDDEDDAKT